MRRLQSFVLACGLLATVLVSFAPAADQPDPAKTNKSNKPARQASPDRAALEQAFSGKLSGATLVGTFTTDGKEGSKPDRYRVVSAKKLIGDDWIITATMKLGTNEVDIPIPIKIYWADDTPVMSLTDLTIPGMGTFTSRVMFYGDRYAGTWQHGDHGGTFAGVIEKGDAPQPEKSPDQPGKKEPGKK